MNPDSPPTLSDLLLFTITWATALVLMVIAVVYVVRFVAAFHTYMRNRHDDPLAAIERANPGLNRWWRDVQRRAQNEVKAETEETGS